MASIIGVEIAVEKTGELVDGDAGAMVGDPALREVVGADLLRAVAAADHLAPLLALLVDRLLLLDLVAGAT